MNEIYKGEGGCLCGTIRYKINGVVLRKTNCHCIHCRKSTGAPFVTWAVFNIADFSITSGTPNEHPSRKNAIRQFCGACGTQLTFFDKERPDSIDVTVCSLDDVESIEPDDNVWSKRKVSWLRLNDGLPQYQSGRDAE